MTIQNEIKTIDAHVGQRLRKLRQMTKTTQHQVAETLGVSFQQIQKYERGTNRLSAGRLFILAGLFDVPVTFFYEEIPLELKKQSPFPARNTPRIVQSLYNVQNSPCYGLICAMIKQAEKEIQISSK